MNPSVRTAQRGKHVENSKIYSGGVVVAVVAAGLIAGPVLAQTASDSGGDSD